MLDALLVLALDRPQRAIIFFLVPLVISIVIGQYQDNLEWGFINGIAAGTVFATLVLVFDAFA